MRSAIELLNPYPLPNTEEAVELGRKLREARDSTGLSQYEVAAAIGVSRSMVRDYEDAKRRIKPIYMRRLCEFFKLREFTLEPIVYFRAPLSPNRSKKHLSVSQKPRRSLISEVEATVRKLEEERGEAPSLIEQTALTTAVMRLDQDAARKIGPEHLRFALEAVSVMRELVAR